MPASGILLLLYMKYVIFKWGPIKTVILKCFLLFPKGNLRTMFSLMSENNQFSMNDTFVLVE